MLTLRNNQEPLAKRLSFGRLHGRVFVFIEMVDGEVVGVPVSRYPTLARASAERRKGWRLVGGGIGFSWPALDLDLSVRGMLAGQPEAARKPNRLAM